MGYLIARLVAIISLSCGAVLSWASAPYQDKGRGETALVRRLASHIRPGDVTIADRNFSGYFLQLTQKIWTIHGGHVTKNVSFDIAQVSASTEEKKPMRVLQRTEAEFSRTLKTSRSTDSPWRNDENKAILLFKLVNYYHPNDQTRHHDQPATHSAFP